MSVAETTPSAFRTLLDFPTLGLEITLQFVPFHCSVSVRPSSLSHRPDNRGRDAGCPAQLTACPDRGTGDDVSGGHASRPDAASDLVLHVGAIAAIHPGGVEGHARALPDIAGVVAHEAATEPVVVGIGGHRGDLQVREGRAPANAS